MADDRFTIELAKQGALLKFEDGMYGLAIGNDIHLKDEHTLIIDGYEVAAIMVRYANERRSLMGDEFSDTEDDVVAGVGNALKELRDEAGMSQVDFESISNYSISRIENHHQLPQIPTIEKICNELEISIGKFLSRATVKYFEERNNGD